MDHPPPVYANPRGPHPLHPNRIASLLERGHRPAEPAHRLAAAAAAAQVVRNRDNPPAPPREHCTLAAVAVAEEAPGLRTNWKAARPGRMPPPHSKRDTWELSAAAAAADTAEAPEAARTAAVVASTVESPAVAHTPPAVEPNTDWEAEHWQKTWCQSPATKDHPSPTNLPRELAAQALRQGDSTQNDFLPNVSAILQSKH